MLRPARRQQAQQQAPGSRERAMRRSRAAPKGDEGDDDSSPMVVGTGVTMDYSAVDNPSLNVSVFHPAASLSLRSSEEVSRYFHVDLSCRR